MQQRQSAEGCRLVEEAWPGSGPESRDQSFEGDQRSAGQGTVLEESQCSRDQQGEHPNPPWFGLVDCPPLCVVQ